MVEVTTWRFRSEDMSITTGRYYRSYLPYAASNKIPGNENQTGVQRCNWEIEEKTDWGRGKDCPVGEQRCRTPEQEGKMKLSI